MSEISTLMKSRNALKGYLTRVLNDIKSEIGNDTPDKSVLIHRLESIENKLKVINEITRKIQIQWESDDMEQECNTHEGFTLTCIKLYVNCQNK